MNLSNFSGILCFIFLAACQNHIPFDKAAWKVKLDMNCYPYRNKMLNDLTANHKITGLTYSQLTELLGPPGPQTPAAAGLDGREIFYTIIIKYDKQEPIYTQTLEIKLSPDSVVTGFRVAEWRKYKGLLIQP